MNTFGEKIRELRETQNLPLRKVASFIDVDQAILSKIERGQRKASREQVVKLAEFFNINEKELLVEWLSDKILYDIIEESVALEALQVAEEKIAYLTHNKTDKTKIINAISDIISSFPGIERAWIFGSFSRAEEDYKSDIDIVIKTQKTFSYFDLAEVKYKLEKEIKRKIDIGFIDNFRPHILKNIKPDLKLIYEKKQ